MEKDQEFVEFLVKAIVDNPDAVQTERKVDEMGVLITLKVDPKDLGQVIGRQGQTAKAIRTLLRVVGAKSQARVNLKIYEPEGSRPAKTASSSTATSASSTLATEEKKAEAEEVDTSAIDNLNI